MKVVIDAGRGLSAAMTDQLHSSGVIVLGHWRLPALTVAAVLKPTSAHKILVNQTPEVNYIMRCICISYDKN